MIIVNYLQPLQTISNDLLPLLVVNGHDSLVQSPIAWSHSYFFFFFWVNHILTLAT